MKETFIILLFTVFFFSTVFTQTSADNLSKAKEFIDLLEKGEFAKAESLFSDEDEIKDFGGKT